MDVKLLFEGLRKWGCDIDGALDRFLNDEVLYVSCLEEFSLDENFKLLEDALSNDDLAEIFNCVHSIKGVSGNLGLIPIYELACTIVNELKKSERLSLKFLCDRLKQQYEKFAYIIKKLN